MALYSDDKLKSTYTTSDGAIHDYPYTGNRIKEGDYISSHIAVAEKITSETNPTNPDLHRRINTDNGDTKIPPEYETRKYSLFIQDVDSYRTIEKITHDDNTDDSERP